jgi:phage terminase small subunit
MENENLIQVTHFCSFHNIDRSFLEDLHENELIRFTVVDQEYFLEPDELAIAEKFTRLHSELGINPAGLDVIRHLLDRMDNMRREIWELKRRLEIYE